ncbi:MAG TPA: carboxypeptidase-like regulatory domain-containing protein, partial [Candidatus Angelobacter sp.]|nr:carboxypeptidase-like regulatory domain-containing protein [Candidatus Angelobacter sp.]
RRATTDSSGHWVVSNFPTGNIKIQVSAKYFKTAVQTTAYDAGQPSRHDFRLTVGEASTTIEVTSAAPLIETTQAQVTNTFSGNSTTTYAGVSENGRKDRDEKKGFVQNGASSNVLDLQKRVAGVLPVRVDVPRAGNSYRFARALVLDEETKVTFSYKTK